METSKQRKFYDLPEAFLMLESENECRTLIKDLCTPSEIKAVKERWLVAQLLDLGGSSYRTIHEKTKVSIATITRVARFLLHENNDGYKSMLAKANIYRKKSQAEGEAQNLCSIYEVFLLLESVDEFKIFIKDLCTPSEIKAMSERWSVAQLLDMGGLSYREIHDKTKVSIATITRVARFLLHETNDGYKSILSKANNNYVSKRLKKV